MRIIPNLLIALANLKANLLRTILTMVIIAVGIMALVGIQTALNSMTGSLNASFSDMGANTYSFVPGGQGVKSNRERNREADVITIKHGELFKKEFNFPAMVSLSTFVSSIAELKAGNEKSNPNVTCMGVDENYLSTTGLDVEYGRNFTAKEAKNGHNLIIIGSDITKILFKDNPDAALGNQLIFRSRPYQVIGILKSKGATMNQQADRQVLIPIMNAKRYYGYNRQRCNVSVTVEDPLKLDEAIQSGIGVFRNVRKLKTVEANDFEIEKSDDLAEELQEDTKVVRIASWVIGIITLIGAAIGLMNIMLVSVTERTKEIGIIKSLGATQAVIRMQFLLEAVTVTIFGGIIGITLGIIAGNIVAHFGGGVFVMPWDWIAIGIIMCVGTGVVAGLYPAVKASRLDPIEALRYE